MSRTSSSWWRDDRLLWIDSRGGLAVGVFVLLLSPWLSGLYGLPRDLLLVMGLVNLLYGSASGLLHWQRPRPIQWIIALVVANAMWVPVCLTLLVRYADTARPLGLVALAFEALWVGGLAVLEWRHREALAAPGAAV